VKKETHKPREEAFVCLFCGRAGHLDEFCLQRSRIERRRFDYVRNSYHDEFSDFPPCSFSCALPCTSSRALPQFSHGPNHLSYGFGSWENRFEPRRFGYGPRPHRGDRFPCRLGFPDVWSHSHFELRHLNVPYFLDRSSCPTRASGEVLKTVKTSSDHMVKCWIPKIYLTNPGTEPLTFSCPLLLDEGLEDKWLMDSGCSRHMTKNKKWFSSLTPLSHKEYVTFGDDKKVRCLVLASSR
jgi:hypothetical protein